MSSLCDLQAAFAGAAMRVDAPVPDGVTSHSTRRPTKRFNVYRNNIYASLTAVLHGRFPAVSRLVGDEFFKAIARVYVEQRPPRSPVLMEYGADFPGFLKMFEPVGDVHYLPDVARIEWAWNIAYYAADAEPVGAAVLAQIAPERAAELAISLHPSLSTVRSRFPVVTIWEANAGDGEAVPIDVVAGGEDAMILRPGTNVEVRRLPACGAVFIEALRGGRSLAQAAGAAIERAAEFDLQVNLTGLLRSGAVVAAGEIKGRDVI